MATPLSRKLVIVGDGMVGKTALLWSYVHREFCQDYIPTVFETTVKPVKIRSANQMVDIGIWDTGGQEEFDQIRQFAYPASRIILLCYAIDCKTSLNNVLETWITEINQNCPNVPIMLVGCKSDKRGLSDYASSLVTMNEVLNVADKINVSAHIECSAKTGSNVVTLFEWAAEIIHRIDEKEAFMESSNINSRNSFRLFKSLSIRRQNQEESAKKDLRPIGSELPRKKKKNLSFLMCGLSSKDKD